MATVYSLVCWGGSAGKSVTVSSSTDYVTLTNHGLRNATGVAFTSGTLPTVAGTALALNTTYYAKSISSSTFELYYDSSLTSKIDFTSTGSSLVMKSAYYLGLSDKSRWTTSGVERIYDGVGAWNTGRSAASLLDVEVCEIGMAYTEYRTSALTISVPSAKNIITSVVDGTRSGGFHFGIIDSSGYPAGFVMNASAGLSSGNILRLSRYGNVVDGIAIIQTATFGVSSCIDLYASNCEATNNIVIGYDTSNPTTGCINIGSTVVKAIGNLCLYGAGGINVANYMYGSLAANNTICRANVGMRGSSVVYGYFYNNICVGNTTNWSGTITNIEDAANNAGLSGEAWIKGSSPRYTIATTDFYNYAGHDYSPAAVTSPQVEQGVLFYGAGTVDIGGSALPSYPGSNYNTAVTAGSFVTGLSYTIATVGTTDFTLIGASTNTVGVTFKATGAGTGTGTATLNANLDIGAYEFDLGYGAWPATFMLTIDNVVVGSAIRIEESDGTLIEFRTATGTSEVFTMGASLGTVAIIIRKSSSGTKYLPYETQTTAFDGEASIYVLQTVDTIAA